MSVQQRNKNSIPDNDAAIKQLVTKQQLNEQQQQSLSHSSSPYIDSNKFLNEREMIDQSIKSRNSCKCYFLKFSLILFKTFSSSFIFHPNDFHLMCTIKSINSCRYFECSWWEYDKKRNLKNLRWLLKISYQVYQNSIGILLPERTFYHFNFKMSLICNNNENYS